MKFSGFVYHVKDYCCENVRYQQSFLTCLKKNSKIAIFANNYILGPSNYQPPTKKSRRDRFHDNFDYMLDTVDELGDKRSVDQPCQPRTAEKEEQTIFCLNCKNVGHIAALCPAPRDPHRCPELDCLSCCWPYKYTSESKMTLIDA